MHGYLETCDTLDSRQFQIVVKRLADSFSYGTDSSPYRGAGVEYVQSRPYQYGDPMRSVDWRVSARAGKIFVKEFEAPKQFPCYLLIDTSASMTVSSEKRSKYAMAVHIAGGLALACLDRVSPVGVVGVGSREIRIEPSLSKHQIMQWLHRLRTYRFDETTSLGRRIDELSPSLHSRALVTVLSDLHDPKALPALKLLSQSHDCAVLQFRDPAEAGLRGSGFVRGREAETGRDFVARGGGGWIDQENIDRQLRRAGIDHMLIETDQPFAHKVRYFFESRDLLGKGAR